MATVPDITPIALYVPELHWKRLPFKSQKGPIHVTINANAEIDQKQGTCELKYTINAVVVRVEAKESLFKIDCTLVIVAEIDGILREESHNELLTRALGNVLWPYFRELFSNVVVRAGLPVINLPIGVEQLLSRSGKAPKKSPAKKSPAKKSPAKKSPAKKSPAKKGVKK